MLRHLFTAAGRAALNARNVDALTDALNLDAKLDAAELDAQVTALAEDPESAFAAS